MEFMVEDGFENCDGTILRTFESDNYRSRRVFWENGIIDFGSSKICFDFSDCDLSNDFEIEDEEEIFDVLSLEEDNIYWGAD